MVSALGLSLAQIQKRIEKPMNQTRNDKIQVIALLILFSLPIVLAYAGYWLGWFKNVGVAAHGRLLNPVVTAEDYKFANNQTIESAGKAWKILIYGSGERCDQMCELNVALAEHVRLALGKDASRVRLIYVHRGKRSEAFNTGDVKTLAPGVLFWEIVQGPLIPGKIYIMDPMGNVMLEYDWAPDAKSAPLHGKGMLKDLRKLLKYSHIG